MERRDPLVVLPHTKPTHVSFKPFAAAFTRKLWATREQGRRRRGACVARSKDMNSNVYFPRYSNQTDLTVHHPGEGKISGPGVRLGIPGERRKGETLRPATIGISWCACSGLRLPQGIATHSQSWIPWSSGRRETEFTGFIQSVREGGVTWAVSRRPTACNIDFESFLPGGGSEGSSPEHKESSILDVLRTEN